MPNMSGGRLGAASMAASMSGDAGASGSGGLSEFPPHAPQKTTKTRNCLPIAARAATAMPAVHDIEAARIQTDAEQASRVMCKIPGDAPVFVRADGRRRLRSRRL